MLARCLLFSVSFAVACAGSAPAPGPVADAPAAPAAPAANVPEPDLSPAQTLRAAESRLVQAPWVRVVSDIEASGAVSVAVTVDVAMMTDNRLRFVATGTFAGQPLSVCFISDGATAGGGAGAGMATPDELNRAVVIGWVRMGFLHNVAMLMGGHGPDHADGGVAEWVQTVRERWAPARVSPAVNERVIDFDLVVAGQPSGRVSLTTDATTNLPDSRLQVVQFPQGDMRVLERYRYQRAEPPGPDDFTPGRCPGAT